MQKKIERTERIIQFGEGGFLRGFVDWIIQITNEKTDFDGSVVVVQPIETGMCDALTAQNCVYTHIMRGIHNGVPTVDKKVIDVISRCVKPYDDYDEYIKLAENPNFRFVFSNTTEAGIVFDENDKPTDRPPHSFPAKVTALLYRRFELDLDGFIFMPCELIDKNGDTLKKTVLMYADSWKLGESFKKWVCEKNIFCNTLVDRIVTGYPKDEVTELGCDDKMLDTSELFHLWVIDGPESILNELPLDKTGLNIILTDNIELYRTRKVRILNGAHTAMIPYALLNGIETVGECMKDSTMRTFVEGCVYNEIIPTLDLPRESLEEYAANVFERFENPFIKHQCAAIALNSVSKFRVRVLPSILEYIKRENKMPNNLLFSFARLIEFYKTGEPNDDNQIIEFIKNNSIKEILSDKRLWGENIEFLADEVTKR